jgi:hypothetical protein
LTALLRPVPGHVVAASNTTVVIPGSRFARPGMTAEKKFCFAFNLICPSSPLRKNIPVHF